MIDYSLFGAEMGVMWGKRMRSRTERLRRSGEEWSEWKRVNETQTIREEV